MNKNMGVNGGVAEKGGKGLVLASNFRNFELYPDSHPNSILDHLGGKFY